jgi:hypothetical protein
VSRVKPADVRFYLDADVLGLARVLSQLRSDVTYPGDVGAVVHKRQRAACPVASPSVKDTEWIPLVAANGWLIITRDRRIQDHRREIEAVRENGARMVALSGPEARGTFAQLEIVMTQWRAILKLAVQPGPFVYTATRTRLRPVSLD